MSHPDLATALVVPFEHLRMTDVETVGGKNASLGEMISQLTASGVRVPGGFATTAHAFRQFLAHNGLADRINARLSTLNTDDVRALAEHKWELVNGGFVSGEVEAQTLDAAAVAIAGAIALVNLTIRMATNDAFLNADVSVFNLMKEMRNAPADELMITTMIYDHGARRHSYELMAQEFGLEPR